MISLPLLAALAFLAIAAAVWYKPGKKLPSLPSLSLPESSRPVATSRNAFDEDVEIIVAKLRKEEADRKYKRAMERLNNSREDS
jgi:hypothetical protein